MLLCLDHTKQHTQKSHKSLPDYIHSSEYKTRTCILNIECVFNSECPLYKISLTTSLALRYFNLSFKDFLSLILYYSLFITLAVPQCTFYTYKCFDKS